MIPISIFSQHPNVHHDVHLFKFPEKEFAKESGVQV